MSAAAEYVAPDKRRALAATVTLMSLCHTSDEVYARAAVVHFLVQSQIWTPTLPWMWLMRALEWASQRRSGAQAPRDAEDLEWWYFSRCHRTHARRAVQAAYPTGHPHAVLDGGAIAGEMHIVGVDGDGCRPAIDVADVDAASNRVHGDDGRNSVASHATASEDDGSASVDDCDSRLTDDGDETAAKDCDVTE